MNTILANAIEHWAYVAPLVNPPRNAADYQTLVTHLDVLLDQIGDDERHPLAKPIPPQPPVPGECCERGCEMCVWVYYRQALQRYERAEAEWLRVHEQNPEGSNEPFS